MEEYNINNIQKINSINFINITEDKLSKSKMSQCKTKQIDFVNPISGNSMSNQKGKYSQRNLSKIKPNIKFLNTVGNDANKYQKMNNIYNNINENKLPMPLSSASTYQPTIKKLNNRTEIKNGKYSFPNRRIIEPMNNNYNNNTYNNVYDNNYDYSNESILKNKHILYEKQINELKRQNKDLLNKLSIYLNDIKYKSLEINDLQKKNKNLQNQLNKKINDNNIYNNSNEQNITDIIYKSKIFLPNQNININHSNDFRIENNIEGKNKIKMALNEKVKSASKKNIKNNNKSNKSNIIKVNNINIRNIIEQKNKDIKILYQKIQKMKKDIELITLKNGNLTKLLTQKNIDLIGYQKNDMDKDKKIEQLTSLLFQRSYNNKSLSNKNEYYKNINSSIDEKVYQSESFEEKKNKEIFLLNNEIKSKNIKIKEINEECKKKNKKIEDLIKTINELENNIKGMKLEEKNKIDIKKYKNDILIKEDELNKMAIRLNNYEEEKNNLLNNINNKEKEFNIFNNKIFELNNNLENYKNIVEQKNIEIKTYINDKQDLLKELKELKDKKDKIDDVNNSNKEDNILLKKIEKLTNENTKLLDQINSINSKYHAQKKLLSEANKKLENMKEIPKTHEIEVSTNNKKIKFDPDKFIIIGKKKYKNLIWYLIYKKPNNNILNENEENNYDNYVWLNELAIKNEDLKKNNKFEDDNEKNKELKEYILDLQKKLEKKEESISKLDYQNKKLTKELLNKTANLKANILLPKNSKDDNFTNSFHTNKNIENEIKYKNIFEKLNQKEKIEKHLNNQIILLKEQLKEKNNLENNFPHDMKHIDPHLNDSGFLDDDDSGDNKNIKDLVIVDNNNPNFENEIINNENNNNNENKNENNNNENNENNDDNNINKEIEIIDLNDNLSKNEEFKSNKLSSKEDPFKESEKKVDEFLMKGAGDEDDFDEVKIITKQMNFLKAEIKENREKNKKLGNEIKDLFSKIKCNDKNRKNIVQICQLLGFSPQIVDQIISNKKIKK